MAEKRDNKRKISRFPVKFGEGGYQRNAFSSNFSRFGFFVRTNRPYKPDTILQFELHLKNGKKILVKGKVIHIEKAPSQFSTIRRNGMGIEIIEESREYLDFLKSLNILEK